MDKPRRNLRRSNARLRPQVQTPAITEPAELRNRRFEAVPLRGWIRAAFTRVYLYLDEGPPEEPVVPDRGEPLRASKTDMPRGPIVIRTGSPFLVLAFTTKDSATTVTSWKPACVRSCWICWDTAMLWLVLADGCEAVGELDG